ncbi:hypothetical protein E2C01_040419 [Portunus trituberculatus]|uniref:Uncharacterized protein n=1 Tax=Portunus trituberculatus TaxID=210409 RepID=A0A5B7FQQ4_PORTR|nr:hypothetical protein [Portunus trituberculatus]
MTCLVLTGGHSNGALIDSTDTPLMDTGEGTTHGIRQNMTQHLKRQRTVPSRYKGKQPQSGDKSCWRREQ